MRRKNERDEYLIVEFDIPLSTTVDRGRWQRISDGNYEGTPDYDGYARSHPDRGDYGDR
jgi:hypothetical protein